MIYLCLVYISDYMIIKWDYYNGNWILVGCCFMFVVWGFWYNSNIIVWV